MAQDSSRCAAAPPCAGTRTTSRPCGAAGGNVSRGVTTARFESADSSASPGYCATLRTEYTYDSPSSNCASLIGRGLSFADFHERRFQFHSFRGGRGRLRLSAIDAVAGDRRSGTGGRLFRRGPREHHARTASSPLSSRQSDRARDRGAPRPHSNSRKVSSRKFAFEPCRSRRCQDAARNLRLEAYRRSGCGPARGSGPRSQPGW